MSSSVPTITLNDGTKIPIVGYGTGTANYAKDSKDVVLQALKNGYYHWDTAEMYANEDSVGKALQESGLPREKIFLTTKCGSADPRASLEKSLKLLGTSYVDLYLIHSPLLVQSTGLGKAWSVMEELQKEGKAKSIGVSNYRIEDLKETLKTAKVTPSANQIEFHPYVYDKAGPLAAYCKEQGIKLECYGPLTPIVRAAGGPVDSVLSKIAKTLGEGVTPGQVLLKWAQQVSEGVIVTTSSKPERLVEQLKAFTEVSELSKEQVEEIIAASKGKHFRAFMHHMDE